MQVCDRSIHTHECPRFGTGLDSLAQERCLSEAERRGQAREKESEKSEPPTGCCNQKDSKTLQSAGSLRSALRFTGPRLICVSVNTKPFRNSQRRGPPIAGERTCSAVDVWISVTCNHFTHAATSATAKLQLIPRWYHDCRKL